MRIAPSFDAYGWPVSNVEYGIPGIHQQLNITVAFQLIKIWLEKVHKFSKSDMQLIRNVDNAKDLDYKQKIQLLSINWEFFYARVIKQTKLFQAYII